MMNSQRNYENLRVTREKELTASLQRMLCVDQLAPVFERAQNFQQKNYLRSIVEGRAFRLTEKLFPHLFRICRQVLETLEFNEPVQFFVINDPETNASAILKEGKMKEHLVILNSALIEKFDDKELKFIIGHEIGHIIFETVRLDKFFRALYPEIKNIPYQLVNQYFYWKKLSELSADRVGFISSPDLESAISTFFKLSAGIQLNKHDFNFAEYLKEVDRTLEQYIERNFVVHQSHPINLLRVKALSLFSKSRLLDGNLEEDKELVKKMDEILDYMQLYPDSELDYYRTQFIIVAGVLFSGIDSKISPEEIETIKENLSMFYLFPGKAFDRYFHELMEHQNPVELLADITQKLVSIDPSERYPMLQFLVHVMIADRVVKTEEIAFLLDFSSKVLGFSEIETSRLIMDMIQKKGFKPKA
ncbi:M48 family metalloprotease [Calditrichota bacterium LG25]